MHIVRGAGARGNPSWSASDDDGGQYWRCRLSKRQREAMKEVGLYGTHFSKWTREDHDNYQAALKSQP